jgi:hypothetical protein
VRLIRVLSIGNRWGIAAVPAVVAGDGGGSPSH